MKVRLPGRHHQPSVHDGILDHYRRFRSANTVTEVHWTPGPMSTRLPDFHIAKIAPQQAGGMWVFASIGAWRATEAEDHGVEFVVAARAEGAAMLYHVATTAFYHAGPPDQRLGVGHTVPLGEGWVEGSPLTALVVSRPYIWGPSLEHCQLRDRHIQVLWVIPISEAERAFKVAHGLDALESRFEAAHLDYLDPFRPSVVPEG